MWSIYGCIGKWGRWGRCEEGLKGPIEVLLVVMNILLNPAPQLPHTRLTFLRMTNVKLILYLKTVSVLKADAPAFLPGYYENIWKYLKNSTRIIIKIQQKTTLDLRLERGLTDITIFFSCIMGINTLSQSSVISQSLLSWQSW